MNFFFNKEEFKEEVKETVKTLTKKTIDKASKQEVYQAVAFVLKDLIADRWIETDNTYKRRCKSSLLFIHGVFNL